jgi:recombination protein RecT
MSSTAMTTTTDKKGITNLIHAAEHRLAPLLPEGLTLPQLEQIVYFESQKTPAILNCKPATIVSAVARALRSGLELGVTCYLVPFGDTCTFIADYKGLAQLMVASRTVRAVEMEAVREGDDFEFELGLNARLRHVPVWSKDRSTKPITHAYVVLRLPNGAATFKVMGADEIDAIRKQHSKQWKSGPLVPWYACKTVLRQISKTMPKDKRLALFYAAMEQDEAADLGNVEDAEVVAADSPRPASVTEDGVDLEMTDEEIAAMDAAVSEGKLL